MKSISITFKARGASFSLSYHHHIQGMIYKLLSSNSDYSDFLHEGGYENGGRSFKLFTFSSLRGPKTIRKDYVYFPDFVFLDVRSVSDVFTDCLVAELNSRGQVEIMGNNLPVHDIRIAEPSIDEGRIPVSFLSPVTAHVTDAETNKTEFLTPFDPRFEKHIDMNFRRKYGAYYGQQPATGISLEAQTIRQRDKYVTWFKNDYIVAWRGEYELKGDPEHLTFLYYAGLGARNSAGFGMFTKEKK
jgi:CRISPR-associated endoribonuclease Cas6